MRCADLSVEVASEWEQAAPLAVRVKELEEDLARLATERDTTQAKAEQEATAAKTLEEELGTLKTAYQLQGGSLAEAREAAQASQEEALRWRRKAEGKFHLRELFV